MRERLSFEMEMQDLGLHEKEILGGGTSRKGYKGIISCEVVDLIERYSYDGGYFVSLGNRMWEEWQGSQKAYNFVETERDNEWIFLNDASRNIFVALPINGGKSYYAWGGDTNWTELFDVSKASANIRDKAKAILDRAVPEGKIIKSNENPPTYGNDFLRLTNTSHLLLMNSYRTGGQLTACNDFVNWYARKLGINDISDWFNLKDALHKISKGYAWVESTANGPRPKYGDILRHKPKRHVDVAIGFTGPNGTILRRVAAGQGDGNRYSTHPRPPEHKLPSLEDRLKEYDVLRRVDDGLSGRAPYNWQNLEGWLDIELYFR